MIPEELLKRYNGCTQRYNPGEMIFKEKTRCESYFQIVRGRVKLSNLSEGGKEFIQNIFEAPQGFGEELLFASDSYPVNAIAMTGCMITELPRKQFLSLLKKHPQYYVEIVTNLSNRMRYKMMMSHAVSCKEPQTRLRALMDYLKSTSVECQQESGYRVPLTRQQMADLTGLTVETVIRTVKAMEGRGLLKIRERKICY